MQIRQLFHGTDGDKILSILTWHEIRPNANGEIFFSQWRPDSVLMYGPDARRRASFAVRLEVSIPDDILQDHLSKPGVPDTVVLKTARPLRAKVLELYVRELHEGHGALARVVGEHDIRRFLERSS